MNQVCEFGSYCIPEGLLQQVGISPNDYVKMWSEGDSIIIQKLDLSCIFCGEELSGIEYKGKLICIQCLPELPDIYRV